MNEWYYVQLCGLLHHLCDIQLRHRVEAIVAFSDGFIQDCQIVSLLSHNQCDINSMHYNTTFLKAPKDVF